MAAVCGARSRPALCIICCTSVLPGTVLGGSRAFLSKPTFLPAWRDTLWVDGSGRAPHDSPFRTCSWAVVGKGVLVQARFRACAVGVQSRAASLGHCSARVRATRHRGLRLQKLWDGQRKPRGVHRDLEQRLLSFPRLGREVKWIQAHTDSRSAALHGVTEVDRQGNERADKAANNVLGSAW
eukprot:1546231-Amphidinium_carterae.1